ncbi:MAG TPA: GtrA family protein [Acidimicrobiales bacterium]|nr:GtrA family protein [Acidimicrobiales bacterium]
MLSRLQAIYAWLHTHEGRKILRYSMVSVISTAVSLVVIAIVYGGLQLWSEVPSTVFGNAVATFPSYWLNRKWAWGKHGRSHFFKEVVPFWTMAALGIAFSIVGASLARHLGIHFKLHHTAQTLLVLIANFVSFAVFWVVKLLVFNRMFKVVLEEFDEHLTAEESVQSSAVR